MREETQREDFNRLVVADWDSGIARFKRGDGSIYRLFELDRGRGLLQGGSTCDWLRYCRRSTLENRRYPIPWERTDHPAFRCCRLSGGTQHHCKEIKICLLGVCARL